MITALKLPPRQVPLHFRRMEIKYLLPDRYLEQFMDHLMPYVKPDPFLEMEGKGRTVYPVTSLYFDSIDLQSLREKDAGLLSRRKLRLRTYEEEFSEQTPAFLEIKRRHDFIVSKDRLSLSVGHLTSAHPMEHVLGHVLKRVEASEEVTAEAEVMRSWYNLQPTAFVSYLRAPFVGKHDRRFRITVDRGLRGMWKPPRLMGSLPLRPCMSGYSIIELKCNHSAPAWFHDIVQDFGLVHTASSKYAMTVLSLDPLFFGGETVELQRFRGFR